MKDLSTPCEAFVSGMGLRIQTSLAVKLTVILAVLTFSAIESRALTVNAGDIIVGCDNGTVVKVNPATGHQSLLASNLVGVHDLALSPAGDLYILQHARTVTKLNLASGAITNLTSEGLLGLNSLDTFTAGLTLATNGDIYVSVYTYPDNRIVKVNPTTGAQTVAASGWPSGLLTGPIGLAFAPSGELMVADIASSTIVGVNVTNGAQRLVATNIGASAPWGMTVDSNGNIYVGRDGYSSVHNILKISSAGVVSVVAANGLLNDPRDVAIEPGGTLVSCQLGSNSIVRIDPATGNQTLVTSGGLINNTLSLIVANLSVPVLPQLGIRTTVTVSWPTNTFVPPVLQGTTNLQDPLSWIPVGNPVFQIGSNNNVTTDLTSPAKFFRLHWPD